MACFVSFWALVKEWQTLISGVIAIGAAFIGGSYINRQIFAARKIESERIESKYVAARAIFPLTLMELSDYAQQSNRHLKSVLATQSAKLIPKQPDPAKPPPLPAEIVKDLRRMIEYSPDPIRERIASLVSRLQIQVSRVTSLTNELRDGYDDDHSVTVHNIEDYILDSAEIYARSAALLRFVRGDVESVSAKPSAGDIHSALNQTGFWADFYEQLHDRVDHKY